MARIAAQLFPGLLVIGLAACSTTQSEVDPTAWAAVDSRVTAPELAISNLDAASQRKARAAELKALDQPRTGIPVHWRSGRVRGEVVPGPTYQVNSYSCRDYTHIVYRDGPPQRMRGTSCRQPNGSWEPVT